MKKGSKVRLKSDYQVHPLLMLESMLTGERPVLHGEVYTLSEDPYEDECDSCGQKHTFIIMEGFAAGYKADAFEEVPSPEGEEKQSAYIEHEDLKP